MLLLCLQPLDHRVLRLLQQHYLVSLMLRFPYLHFALLDGFKRFNQLFFEGSDLMLPLARFLLQRLYLLLLEQPSSLLLYFLLSQYLQFVVLHLELCFLYFR